MNSDLLKQKAQEVLKQNDLGNWTRPTAGHYPHQWLWDSCFIAIGLAQYDVKRAQKEIISLLRGQWSNGMIPHMIFGDETGYNTSAELWRSHLSPYSPHKVSTSGITQPPMIAEAVVHIGAKLKKTERHEWYKKVWPYLLDYHAWLYNDRDLHSEGMVSLIHPWETGLDNTPPWIEAMHQHQKPLWIKIIEWLHIDHFIDQLRRDSRQSSPNERISTLDTLILYSVVKRIRRKQYDTQKIVLRSHFIIEDVFFNSILLRANTLLEQIGKEINKDIPATTLSSMHKASKALEELWNEESQQYFSRYFITRKSIMQPSIATLMPLYAGTVSKKRAAILVKHLEDPALFGTPYPAPSVPVSSEYYDPKRYWQGPTWINTNWLIIDGLSRYGYTAEAQRLKDRTIEMITKSGYFEYFNSQNGLGEGMAPFSWSAALTIDLLSTTIKAKK